MLLEIKPDLREKRIKYLNSRTNHEATPLINFADEGEAKEVYEEEKEKNEVFEAFTEGLKPDVPAVFLYNLLFIVRRLILIFVVMYMNSYPAF